MDGEEAEGVIDFAEALQFVLYIHVEEEERKLQQQC